MPAQTDPAQVGEYELLATIGEGGIEAVVTSVSYSGHDGTATLQLPDGSRVRSRLAATELPGVGDRVKVSVRRGALAYR